MAGALIGNEVASTEPKRTQTFIVTHDGAGNRLPLMERSFMSFSFGGKHIEDFQLVVTLGDRLSKNLYADFEDVTSQYTTIDGQYYWGTRMNGNTLDFTLSTDYITDYMLEEFKHWFRPGVERDLILAEHPNRFIRARVATPPSMNMIPFGESVDYVINKSGDEEDRKEYKTKTTIYKGDINLSFTMCEPYWTGILNYMPYPGRGVHEASEDPMQQRIIDLLDTIIDTNTLTSKEALKICLEDNIPHDDALYADDDFSIGIKEPYTDIILLSTVPGLTTNGEPQTIDTPKDRISSEVSPDSSTWAQTYSQDVGVYYYVSSLKTAMADYSHADDEDDARIGYLLTSSSGFNFSGNTEDENGNNVKYLFYGGTAPSKPIISFVMNIVKHQEDDEYNGYIVHPINSITSDADAERSYIKVGEHYFKFTTPSICTMYNRVLEKLDNIDEDETIVNTKDWIRENIKNKYVRQWLFYCLDQAGAENDSITSEKWEQARNQFITFFVEQPRWVYDYVNRIREWEIKYEVSFEFNSKTGEAIGKFICRTPDKPINGKPITENVGDMVLSKYLIIDERNHLVDGRVVIGENGNCTKITTNEEIYDLKIIYNNMYF